MNLTLIVEKVIIWGLNRNIIQGSSLDQQLSKLEEEFNELKEAIADDDADAIRDAIGDMTVVLTLMAEIYGREYEDDNVEHPYDPDWANSWFEACLEGAYDEIKNRKGKLIDGVFVKEE